jgi:hypothetical protein
VESPPNPTLRGSAVGLFLFDVCEEMHLDELSQILGARRLAWAAIEARHGALPGVRIADKVLEGVTCIRLDATVTPAHSDKELAEPNFKGFGHHPLLGYCDNTDEPLAGMMRRGSAGSNTTADHLQVLGDAIAALPPKPGGG